MRAIIAGVGLPDALPRAYRGAFERDRRSSLAIRNTYRSILGAVGFIGLIRRLL